MEPRIAELEQLKRDVDAQLDQVQQLTTQLSEERFEAWSGQRNVRAVVDGQGALTGLSIEDDAVGPRVAHLAQLGGEIVEAVAGARSKAAEENARRFRQILPGMFPAPEETRQAEPDGWAPEVWHVDDVEE